MDFPAMLGRGLGRAVLFLQTNDARPFRETILHACTHFLGYDAQAEPSRAQYLYDVIVATGEAEWYATRLRELILSETEVEDWSQFYDVAALFAKNGDKVMRRALHAAFLRDLAAGDHYAAATAIIEMDGLNGFLFIANNSVDTRLPEDDRWYESSFLHLLEERIGKDEAALALDEMSRSNPRLRTVVARISEYHAERVATRRPRPSLAVPDYEEITRQIVSPDGKHYHSRWWRWGEKANDGLLLRLANDLLSEDDEARLVKYLHLFRRRRFPLAIDRILRLARSENKELASAARQALSHVTDPSVRALVLDLMISSSRAWEAVDVLQSNYQDGDYPAVLSLVLRATSRDDFHRLGISARELIEAHPAPGAAPVLLQLYEGGHCAMCRGSVITLLQMLGPLPDWLVKECRYDSDMETRKQVGEERSTPD